MFLIFLVCFLNAFIWSLLVVVDVCLKEVLGDEMVLYTVALLVSLGPAGVWKR